MTAERSKGSVLLRPAIRHAATGLTTMLALCLLTGAGPDDQDTRLDRLVAEIARGDEVEAAAANEQLIELIVGPLVDAIGSLDARPPEEQVRLRNMMARLTGALRMRVFRVDLPAADRKLFDEFAAAYPELVQRLFDGNYAVRKAAVFQVPLEPNTGAGVLIAGKVDDEDEDVALAALQVAARLHDVVVARNLTRYIEDATVTLESGFYGPEQQDIARSVALLVWRSIDIVVDARLSEGLPVVIRAVHLLGRSRYWDHYQRAKALRVLGQTGERTAAPALLDFLDDPSRLRSRVDQNKRRVSETVGDVALLSLLRLHKLPPEDFGLVVPDPKSDFAGYLDDEARREGHRAFRIWHQQHGQTPSSQTQPPTSQPTGEKK